MSVYQPKTDPIPSRRECTFLTDAVEKVFFG
jgi:hypothetical protein